MYFYKNRITPPQIHKKQNKNQISTKNDTSLILQATPAIDTLHSTVNSIPVVSKPTIFTIWDIIQKGGLIMIPIGILFVLTIYIFIERFISIQRASASEGNFINDIKTLIETEKIDDALQLCSKNDLPIARMVEKASTESTIPSRKSKNLLR